MVFIEKQVFCSFPVVSELFERFRFRDYFYQFGEIRSLNVLTAKACAFIAFTTRQAAEKAAERSFNKLVMQGW